MLLAIAGSLLAGCAIPVVRYPEYATPPTLSVSSDTLGAWTQVPAGDHVLPNSQVSVGGRNSTRAQTIVAPLLGPLGSLAVAANDQSAHAGAAGSAPDGRTLKFHAPLTAALRGAAGAAQGRPVATVLAPDANADIKVMPTIRLVLNEGDAARAIVGMSARFTDASTGQERSKGYYYTDPNPRRFQANGAGWFDNNAAALDAVTGESFRLVSRLMIDDLAGRYAKVQGSDSAPRMRLRNRFTQQEATVVVIDTHPTGWIVSPMFQDTQPLWQLLLIVDRGTVDVLEGAR
jgi:hypothetical protein